MIEMYQNGELGEMIEKVSPLISRYAKERQLRIDSLKGKKEDRKNCCFLIIYSCFLVVSLLFHPTG